MSEEDTRCTNSANWMVSAYLLMKLPQKSYSQTKSQARWQLSNVESGCSNLKETLSTRDYYKSIRNKPEIIINLRMTSRLQSTMRKSNASKPTAPGHRWKPNLDCGKREAKKQAGEQGTWRSMERDAKLMGTNRFKSVASRAFTTCRLRGRGQGVREKVRKERTLLMEAQDVHLRKAAEDAKKTEKKKKKFLRTSEAARNSCHWNWQWGPLKYIRDSTEQEHQWMREAYFVHERCFVISQVKRWRRWRFASGTDNTKEQKSESNSFSAFASKGHRVSVNLRIKHHRRLEVNHRLGAHFRISHPSVFGKPAQKGTSVFGRTKSESHSVFEQPSAGGAFGALEAVSSSVSGQPAPQAAFRASVPSTHNHENEYPA
ncbi:MAG: hypothetical protein NXY57DRAFT_1078109 [Lentinula lateritia]|nr:MAG: hypothetical protein NXY57DRAFT_1078109 [Lentinula lateritia]